MRFYDATRRLQDDKSFLKGFDHFFLAEGHELRICNSVGCE